ncbi:hypothetical protein FNF27_03439 [Cafeteria roenbergensis]|uniref:GRAM domain-containing protein n=5 Tax=Cafeteria roenbergensis TaxID=33653 RepID=A0A5A8EHA4_CAFRO|nr:hypothetical protein FNF27_03439 [Cafeteria roenbergensis]
MRAAGLWCDAALRPDPEALNAAEQELFRRIETGTDGKPRTSWDVFSDTDEEADTELVDVGDMVDARAMAELTTGSGAALRRHHFVVLVSRFLPLLADSYGAGSVFDALVEDSEPVTVAMPAAAVLVTDAERRRVELDGAAGLAGGGAAGLAAVLQTPRTPWETLRDRLSLDTREMLIRSELYATAAVALRAHGPVFTPEASDPAVAKREVRGLSVLYKQMREEARQAAGAEHKGGRSALAEAATERAADAGSAARSAPAAGGAATPQRVPSSRQLDNGGGLALRRRALREPAGGSGQSPASNATSPATEAEGTLSGRVSRASSASFLTLASSSRRREQGARRRLVLAPGAAEAFRQAIDRGRAFALVLPRAPGLFALVGSAPSSHQAGADQRPGSSEVSLLDHPAFFGRSMQQWAVDNERERLRLRRQRQRGQRLREGETPFDNTRGWGVFTDSEANSGIEQEFGADVAKAEIESRQRLRDSLEQVRAPTHRWSTSKGVRARAALLAAASQAKEGGRSGRSEGSSLADGAAASGAPGGAGSAETAEDPSEADMTPAGALATDNGRRLLETGRTMVRLSGQLFLSDRALYLVSGREVLVVPVAGIQGRAEYCETPSWLLGVSTGAVDNGLHLPNCAISHVDQSRSAAATQQGEEGSGASSMLGHALGAAREIASPAEPPAAVLVPRCVRADPAAASGGVSAGSAGAAGAKAQPESETSKGDTLLQPVRVRKLQDGAVASDVTIVLPRWKDMVVSRGEERQGGRRRVVREAVNELQEASIITGALRRHPDAPISRAARKHGLVSSEATAVLEPLAALDLRRLKSSLSHKQSAAAASEDRLALMAGLNLHRTRALFKTTGRCITALLHCTNATEHLGNDPPGAKTMQAEVIEDVDAALVRAWGAERPTGLHPRDWVVAPALSMRAAEKAGAAAEPGAEPEPDWTAVPVAATCVLSPVDRLPLSCEDGQLLPRLLPGAADAFRQAAAHALAQARIEAGGSKGHQGTVAIATAACEGSARWLIHAAAFASHDAEASSRRHAAQLTFGPETFRLVWSGMVSSLFRPILLLRSFMLYLWAWESPAVSFVVLVSLLGLCWFDLLQYAMPLGMAGGALCVVAWHALRPSLREMIIRSLQPRAAGQNSRFLSWRQQYLRLSQGVGTGQFRIGKLNLAFTKLHSLVTWRDPIRTQVLVVALIAGALFFSVVPARIWFAALVLMQFTRPMRTEAPGLFLVALNRFIDGIPVPSAAAEIGTSCRALRPGVGQNTAVSFLDPGLLVQSVRPAPLKKQEEGSRRPGRSRSPGA